MARVEARNVREKADEGEEEEIIGHWSLVSAFHEHKKHIFFLASFLALALKQSESLCVYLTKNPSLRLWRVNRTE